jgi:hypothetical protein
VFDDLDGLATAAAIVGNAHAHVVDRVYPSEAHPGHQRTPRPDRSRMVETACWLDCEATRAGSAPNSPISQPLNSMRQSLETHFIAQLLFLEARQMAGSFVAALVSQG